MSAFSVAPNYKEGKVWIEVSPLPRKLVTPERAREVAESIESEFAGSVWGDQYDDPEDIAEALRKMAEEVDPQ